MRLVPSLLLSALAFGCSDKSIPAPTPVTAPTSAAIAVAAANPSLAAAAITAPAGAPEAPGAVKGTVAERLDAAGYTYLRLTTPEGDVWAAVPQTTTAVGTDVAIANPMPMNGFESKTLNRKFDKIYFGTLGGDAGGAAPAAGMGAGSGASQPTGAGSMPSAPGITGSEIVHGPTATPPADMGPIKVAKAEGPDGHLITEVFAQKAAMKDKTVAVRGKVVKFSAGVMGSNWVHVRDGSGTDAAKDNDLTFTTQDNVAVGDTVLAKGTAHLDKDFGAGYFYSIIVEQATVTREAAAAPAGH